MASVSARLLDPASRPKGDLEAVCAAGSPPDVPALTGFEFRGYNQPRAAALLGIRKFVKAFYLDGSGQPFGCNTPVAQNGLAAEWLPRPDDDQPKRYAFFRVEPANPDAPDQRQRRAALLDYAPGGNRGCAIPRILRDYLARMT